MLQGPEGRRLDGWPWMDLSAVVDGLVVDKARDLDLSICLKTGGSSSRGIGCRLDRIDYIQKIMC